MRIHEYQAKIFFSRYKIPIPKGGLADSAINAVNIAESLKKWPVVVKAQVHSGGRKKSGGVGFANTRKEVAAIANKIIGMKIVNEQTGPGGKVVKKVLIEEGLDIKEEIYLSFVVDRDVAGVTMIGSRAGGIEIEKVAAEEPEKIIKVNIEPEIGIQPFHCREMVFGLGIDESLRNDFIMLLYKMYKFFTEYDCMILEINPLAITSKNRIIALDAKVEFDSNALFRHPELTDYINGADDNELEQEASRFKLNYISLDGNIGNLVNGAGLAMATMDIIKQAGAEPANFLDVGGGASEEMIENAIRIIQKDKKVKGILINIFGGILRCDVLAAGVVSAATKTGLRLPVVVRMEGTNVDKGREILGNSGLNLSTAVDINDAVRQISEIACN